jgi:nitrous oxide reductase accessory protein NosL
MLLRVIIFIIITFNTANADLLQRGKRVATILCDQNRLQSIDLSDKNFTKEIFAKNICKKMNKDNTEALIVYLKDQKNLTKTLKLTAPKDAKCPVCGMWVAKYPKWVSSIKYQDKTLYFDGVKDMMKYYFDPKRFKGTKEKIVEIKVQDYYSLKPISAKSAYFVIGSNVYGPMGEELIAFKSFKDASSFKDDHQGKKIIRFEEIQESMLY